MSEEDWEERVPNLTGQLAPVSIQTHVRGGYADVFESTWQGQKVAVKKIMAVNHIQSMRRKIRREATIWHKLDHPNVLPLFGFSDDADFQPFGAFVSPWCHYGNSEEYIEEFKDRLSFGLRIKLLLGTAQGVGYLHSCNPPLIHGDLKPANVLVDHSGIPKLCDFGLSKVLHGGVSSGLTTSTVHTGTARYLAIELLDPDFNAVPTLKTDIWALGCVGLKFIFSTDPYVNRPNNLKGEIFWDIRKGILPFTFPMGLDTNHSYIAEWLDSCWRKEPSDRPDIQHLLQKIVEFLPLLLTNESDQQGHQTSPLERSCAERAQVTYDNGGTRSFLSLENSPEVHYPGLELPSSSNQENRLRAGRSMSTWSNAAYLIPDIGPSLDLPPVDPAPPKKKPKRRLKLGFGILQHLMFKTNTADVAIQPFNGTGPLSTIQNRQTSFVVENSRGIDGNTPVDSRYTNRQLSQEPAHKPPPLSNVDTVTAEAPRLSIRMPFGRGKQKQHQR